MWPFRQKTQPQPQPETIVRGAPMAVLSVLNPEQQIALGGLPPEAIAGSIAAPIEPGAGIPAAAFRVNPVFVDFMQHVIRTLGPQDAEMQEGAREQESGSIVIIDLRTPEGVDGNVPNEDVVGIFAVEDGKLGEYHANSKHVVFTVNGLVQLPPNLRSLHIRELMRLKVQAAGR